MKRDQKKEKLHNQKKKYLEFKKEFDKIKEQINTNKDVTKEV